MSLNVYDLGLREIISEIIEDVNAGTVYVCRNVSGSVDSEFEVPTVTAELICSFPFISIREKRIYLLEHKVSSLLDGIITLKSGTTEETRKVKNGDYVFIHVADGYYIVKGSIIEIKAAKISTITEYTIDTATDVPFKPEDINLNLSEEID
jgi:hypothetical protein